MGRDSVDSDDERTHKRARLETADTAGTRDSPMPDVLEQNGDSSSFDDLYGEQENAPMKEGDASSSATTAAVADVLASDENGTQNLAIPGILDGSTLTEAQLEPSHTPGVATEGHPAEITDDAPSNEAIVQGASQNSPCRESGLDIPTETVEEESNSSPKPEPSPVMSRPDYAAETEQAGVENEHAMQDTDVVMGDNQPAAELGEIEHVSPKSMESDTVSQGGQSSESPGASSERAGNQETVKNDNDERSTADLIRDLLSAKPPPEKKPLDPEFLAQAEANKNDKNAEWRFDSSDAETSSSSPDSDSDSDSDSDDEEVTTLKPEEIAAVLMQEGIDEEGDRPAPGPLRTKNEVAEEEIKVERPDIEITPEMKIEKLGTIDNMVGTMILVRAATSGNYRVLNEGSLLVLEDRTVIGTVADTMGRVEEPLYTVRFNNQQEMADFKLSNGVLVFYVPDHSTYVFTQELLAQKGSDASNIHDEEAGEGELDFSDDEAEAEYKRKLKEQRKAKNPEKHQDKKVKDAFAKPAPTPTVMSDEPYVPLQRPANLHEMQSQPPPPPPSSFHHEHRGGHGYRGDRSRGRGGGGGRGVDRGRGRFNTGGRGGGGGGRGGMRGGHGGSGNFGSRGHGKHQFRNQRHGQGQNGNLNAPTGPRAQQPQQQQRQQQQQQKQAKQQPQTQPQNQQPSQPAQSAAQPFNFPLPAPLPSFGQFPIPNFPMIPGIPQVSLPATTFTSPALFPQQAGQPAPPSATTAAQATQAQQAQQTQQAQQAQQAWLAQVFQAQLQQQQPQPQTSQPPTSQTGTSLSNDEAFRALQNTLALLKSQQQQQQNQPPR